MIHSADNQKLKTIRKLQQKRWRAELGLFVAEGEDLVEAAAAAGWEPAFVLRADEDVEAALLDEVSALGSGSRVIGVYEQRWVEPGGRLSVYLHGVSDPGNVGTIVRSVHALADGPAILGPGCADPYSPKAVRASMGSIFARPPACGEDIPPALRIALDGGTHLTLRDALRDADEMSLRRPNAPAEASQLRSDAQLDGPVVLCIGAEREGLPADVLKQADVIASIPQREDGPDSLNAAIAASIGLYELANRMALHG